jgi:hypothetical protein
MSTYSFDMSTSVTCPDSQALWFLAGMFRQQLHCWRAAVQLPPYLVLYHGNSQRADSQAREMSIKSSYNKPGYCSAPGRGFFPGSRLSKLNEKLQYKYRSCVCILLRKKSHP